MICFFFARIKNGEIPLFGHVLLGSPPPLHQSNKSNNTSSQKKRERKMMDRIFRRRLLLRTYTNSSISNTQTHMLRSRRKIQFGKQTCVSTTDHACMAKWRNGSESKFAHPHFLVAGGCGCWLSFFQLSIAKKKQEQSLFKRTAHRLASLRPFTQLRQ